MNTGNVVLKLVGKDETVIKGMGSEWLASAVGAGMLTGEVKQNTEVLLQELEAAKEKIRQLTSENRKREQRLIAFREQRLRGYTRETNMMKRFDENSKMCFMVGLFIGMIVASVIIVMTIG